MDTPKATQIPGSKVSEGPLVRIYCAVLNDLEELVAIPEVTIKQVQQASGVVEVLWPLGVYLGFTEEGLTLGIYGRNSTGEVVHGVSQKPLSVDTCPDIGPEVWNLWKKLRVPPYVLHFNMMGNFDTLFHQTREQHNLQA